MDTDMIEVDLPAGTAAVAVEPEADGGLRSPPESNNALNDGSDSELSELGDEPEDDDIGDVFPDHVENGVPVFTPSMEQFKSFKAYMAKINNYGMQSGIVKVIPPPEWHAKLPALDEAIKTIRVKEPIKQDIMGTSGTYRQANIVHQRSYNLPQWRQLCEQSEHQPPAKRGERRANQDQATRPGNRPKNQAATGKRKSARSTKATPKKKTRTGKEETPDRLPTPVSPALKPEDDLESVKLECSDEDEGTPRPKGGRQPKATTVGARRKYNRREAAGKVDEEAFRDFKYQLEGQDFSPERCDELERAYWKTLTYAPPLYGADMPGSLFDDRTESWNLGKLENLLDVMGTKIPGVNTAYLYLGMWKATFAWHLEDVDLYSINIVHFGAPKQWYSIAQKDARRFEAAMKSIFPADAKACDQFLRHKTFLISPAHLLQNYGIRVNKIVAHPGEFVITFPYGYHSGYNLGYNCAEAVNFALDSWLEFGRVAKKCDCSQAQDSVWIDVREIERKLRGEETEYEETDDEMEEDEDEPTDLPTPPDSSGDNKVKAPKKKRKRTADDKGEQPEVKRFRVRVKFPIREPCILCPNDIRSEPLISTDDGRKAHRICAHYIPETSVEEGEKPIAVDIRYIDKARLELKCNYCRSKKGACFQCSQKKCTRAYHATCAAAAGVLVEEGEIPVFGEDGTEYKDHAIEFSCRFHRSKRDKKLDIDALSQDTKIRKAASKLTAGDVCQLQLHRGDIFAGVVVNNHIDEETLLINLLPKGGQMEVEYAWLLIPDPSDYRLEKPSANAIPLPRTRKEKMGLNTTKRLADDLPRTDDLFAEGYTWAEFKIENLPKNLAQVKVDFSKDNQIWFYLGQTSTEAKAQFTEDPRKPRHNPKGHFLDTIPKAVLPAPRQSYGATYPAKINYHALNASKANRPSPLQHTQISARSEKPYEYKPRIPSDAYRVDPQAYRSQQSFLQNSASNFSIPKPTGYSFGTDPRYLQHNGQVPTAHPGYPGKDTHGPVGALMAPPAQYHTSQAPKANNPFSGRSQSVSNNSRQVSRPSPFTKYPYLQKEHNRSSRDYKTPYRVGGGFMNGYEGNLKEHLQQTLFQNASSSGIPTMPNPLLKAQSQVASYQPLYPHYSHPQTPGQTPGQQRHMNLAEQHAVAQQVWEKKNNAQLHPAIRQEYGSMFHQQYQPVQQPPPQGQQNVSHGQTGQDVRFMQDTRQILHAPQPRYPGPLAPPPSSYAPPYNPDLLNMSIPPPTNRYPYPYPNVPQPPIPTLTPQPKNRYQPPRAPSQDKESESTEGVNKQPDQELWVPPSQRFQDYVKEESELPRPMQDRPTFFLHQKFQKAPSGKSVAKASVMKVPMLPQPALAMAQPPTISNPDMDGLGTVSTQGSSGRATSQPRDFPDVPVDSTSLVEKMILNLKKATAGSSSQGS